MTPTREFTNAKLTVTASVRTDKGLVRDANEDGGRHVSPFDADILTRKGSLTIVADGMGGHASGEVASAMAIELISELYYADESNAPTEALRNAVAKASSQIYAAAKSDEMYFGMGTTLAALIITDGAALTAHVGDSRVYRLRAGNLEMLTLDHSQVMEMVKNGVISMDEARSHDDKNIILRAVGTLPYVEVEVSAPFGVKEGDEFLICSDGLSDMVEDAEIRRAWISTDDVHQTAELLISLAKAYGGHDNITAAVVRISAGNGTKLKPIRATRDFQIV